MNNNFIDKPLVSIIITTYNRSTLLKRALNSAINQTYKNIEIIVIDDNSSDDTKDVVQEYLLHNTNIVYLQKESSSGANISRNMGILNAKGVFIAGLDDDDEFHKDRIRILIDEYDKRYAFVTSLNIHNLNNNKLEYRKRQKVINLEMIYKANYIENQVLVEKSRLIDVGLYDEKLFACQDYDMWIRIMQKYGDVKIVQQYLQTIYEDEVINRISTNGYTKFLGYFHFYKKHKSNFTIETKKELLFNLYEFRGKKLSSKVYKLLKTEQNKVKITKYFFEIDYNDIGYSVLQNFFKFITNLDKKQNYIIYGYGSVGNLLYPFLKNNIVAIIDQESSNNNINNINNIPIITSSEINNFNDAKILLLPILYKDSILETLTDYKDRVILLDFE